MKIKYNEFVHEVADQVRETLGLQYEVTVERVVKNNARDYYGLIIRDQMSEDDKYMAPAIYLDPWYEEYRKGSELDVITEEVIRVYQACLVKRDMLDTSIIDRDNAVTQLYFRVINKEKNEEMLLDSPFVTFFDLALTFHFLCHEEEGSIQGFRITNQIMNDWEYSTEELYEMAMNNMSVLFPTSISSMHDVLTGLLPQGEEFEPDTEEIPMFVLTNERGINGASAMLYGDKLEELSEFLEVDLFILPSSIHEVIVVPALESIYVGQMISLVREVNDTHVEPEEQLSDNIYFYSRNTGKIIMYKE